MTFCDTDKIQEKCPKIDTLWWGSNPKTMTCGISLQKRYKTFQMITGIEDWYSVSKKHSLTFWKFCVDFLFFLDNSLQSVSRHSNLSGRHDRQVPSAFDICHRSCWDFQWRQFRLLCSLVHAISYDLKFPQRCYEPFVTQEWWWRSTARHGYC